MKKKQNGGKSQKPHSFCALESLVYMTSFSNVFSTPIKISSTIIQLIPSIIIFLNQIKFDCTRE